MDTRSGSSGGTDKFRYSRGAARRRAAVPMIILYSALLWILFGEAPEAHLWLDDLFVVLAAAVAVVAIVLSRHPIVRLSVGENGLAVPFGNIRHVAWRQVEDLRIVTRQPLLWFRRSWLLVTLKGRRAGPHLIVPLHVLKASPEDVRASIERFMPVAHTVVEPVTPPKRRRPRRS